MQLKRGIISQFGHRCIMCMPIALSICLILFSSSGLHNRTSTREITVSLNFEEVDSDFLTGRKNYYTDENFMEIPAYQAYRKEMFLLKDTYHAFAKMYDAAKADGITLKIISASRTFDEQKNVWEDKWKKNATAYPDPVERAQYILQFSAMPGTSRHHWGTEIDLNSLQNSYFETAAGKKIYDWLQTHAHAYGFCQTYNSYTIRGGGYNEEKWHWSFYPISDSLLTLFKQKVDLRNMHGFSGVETAGQLHVLSDYILKINYECD